MPQTQTLTFNLLSDSPLTAGAMLKANTIHTSNAFNFVVDCISPKNFSYLGTSPVSTLSTNSLTKLEEEDNSSSSSDDYDNGSEGDQVACSENSSKNYSYYFSGSDNEFEFIPNNDSSDDDINSDFEFVNYEQSDCDVDLSDYEGATSEFNSQPQYQSQTASKLPFWYQNEAEDHIKLIMKLYTDKLITKREFSRSSQPFIGCIKRYATQACSRVFQTFDQVSIRNNQRMPPHKPMPDIREVYLITKWDNDGLPYEFFELNSDGVSFWSTKFRYSDALPSYLYCLPDFYDQQDTINATSFIYSSSLEFKEVGYSNMPWDSSPYSKYVKPRQEFSLALKIDDEDDFI